MFCFSGMFFSLTDHVGFLLNKPLMTAASVQLIYLMWCFPLLNLCQDHKDADRAGRPWVEGETSRDSRCSSLCSATTQRKTNQHRAGPGARRQGCTRRRWEYLIKMFSIQKILSIRDGNGSWLCWGGWRCLSIM